MFLNNIIVGAVTGATTMAGGLLISNNAKAYDKAENPYFVAAVGGVIGTTFGGLAGALYSLVDE